MKKHQRIAQLIQESAAENDPLLDPRYSAYFQCFNSGLYYEAHDVLEHLWLEHRDADRDFYKGLIQLAGGFVHLKKQFEHPTHPTHGRRLKPAARLFLRAIDHLEIFASPHWHLDLNETCGLARRMVEALEKTGFEKNPWSPEEAPTLNLLPA
ncbi:MAG: DUF309 domain-containing protein [Chthoniobacteraceae bacterium]